MDPYAAQWAHYGYAISAPADASAATAAQAAYPAYYNYQQAAGAQAGAQVTTAQGIIKYGQFSCILYFAQFSSIILLLFFLGGSPVTHFP